MPRISSCRSSPFVTDLKKKGPDFPRLRLAGCRIRRDQRCARVAATKNILLLLLLLLACAMLAITTRVLEELGQEQATSTPEGVASINGALSDGPTWSVQR